MRYSNYIMAKMKYDNHIQWTVKNEAPCPSAFCCCGCEAGDDLVKSQNLRKSTL